ncbi:MAG: acetyl/propionyl/methylcrotonyl-CoA carboxylase subunit alpha [Caulobacteraceae bacterium]
MGPLASLLIANRGEIARRIIRTARRLSIRTIAVFSEPDAGLPHVAEADEAVLIGPGPARESYLDAHRILDAARKTGAAAIHPGYGFLSENADFAEAVIAAGLIWVGPPPAAIRAMGRKDEAKRLAAAAGAPITPGWSGADQSDRRLASEAAAIGWPVLIKPVAGGGGKGMRKVERAGDFAEALAGARREAVAAFGDGTVLLERFVSRPRHIEIQVFADRHGGLVHLFERDCSLQRRHQKVIEEAPAPGMSEEVRAALTSAALKAAAAVGYEGAGTVEFIADASKGLSAEKVWFMEMNTRLQVEHPVTEAITGQDLVEWQIRIAAGEPLPLAQEEIRARGWAIEARLYAEDPARGFLPSVGRLARWRIPEGTRLDSGYEEGSAISPFYDPMIAKLIAHKSERSEAAAELARVCRGIEAWPVRTNAAFLANCLSDTAFVAGEVDTAFIEDRLPAIASAPEPEAAAILAALANETRGAAPWKGQAEAQGWRLNASPALERTIFIEGEPFEAALASGGAGKGELVAIAGEKVWFEHGAGFRVSLFAPSDPLIQAISSDGVIRAPMPGRIVQTPVSAGEAVEPGRTLIVLEAMKMEHALSAPAAGKVAEVLCTEGDQVIEGQPLARIEIVRPRPKTESKASR